MYTDLNRKIKFVMKLVELYRPYLFFRGVYVDKLILFLIYKNNLFIHITLTTYDLHISNAALMT